VDTQRYGPERSSRGTEPVGLPDGPLVVCVGRLSEQKGQDVLLDGWPAVREVVPARAAVLVGEGPERERLAERTGAGVSLVGNAADPRDWYAAADVVAVPSRWEGMALVPLEAGSSGRSVVISDVTGAREAVPPACGAVVPVEDAAALALALIPRLVDVRLADDEGGAARRHIETHYDLAATSLALTAVYDELLASR
jgi:glycosyltransferase involved in cell wall biosynthesis